MSYSQFPILNTIQMVPVGIEPTDKYHQVPPDKQWFSEHIRFDEQQVVYMQKIQLTQTVFLQLHREGNNDTELFIYDCTMQQVAEVGIANFIIYPADSGSVYTREDGGTTALAVHTWVFSFSDYDLEEGTYYLYCPVKFYQEDVVIAERPWISEPLDVKEEHIDTVLIEVNNLTNKQDIIWRYTGYGKGDFFPSVKMGLRVEGTIQDIVKYTSSDNYYKEQDYEQRNASSTPWVVKRLYAGGDAGIPPYLMEKVNAYMSCDVVRIDGRRYEKDDGTEWQLGESESYPMYYGELDIRDYNRQDSFTDSRGTITRVMGLGTYPYYVWGVYDNVLGDYTFVNYDIRNDADRDAMVAEFNNLSSYWGYSPEFEIDAAEENVIYTNQGGENFTFSTILLTRYIDVNINAIVNGAQYALLLKRARCGIIWGDNTSENAYINLTSGQTYLHTYANSGSKPFRLYQQDSYCDFIGMYGGAQCVATSFTGELAVSLKEWMMQFNNLGNISLTPFVTCISSIQRITFFYCGITQIDNIFAAHPQGGIFTPTYFNWSLLTYMSLRGNGLSSAEVTAYIGDVYNNLRKATVRQLETRQSPAAPLNVPAIAQKADLIDTYGWTITTD